MTTYKTMDVSDLGDNATEADLQRFQQACRHRKNLTSETDSEVTTYMWADGDWNSKIETFTLDIARQLLDEWCRLAITNGWNVPDNLHGKTVGFLDSTAC